MAQECHIIQHARSDNLAVFDANPDLNYHLQKSSCCYFFHLNVDNIPWTARKAIQYAYDYAHTAEILYNNTVVEHHSPVPDGMLGSNSDLLGLPYYNLTKARQYLFSDPIYGAHLASHGINSESSDEEWISLSQNNPVDNFSFTHYGFGLSAQLIDNMQYIGII